MGVEPYLVAATLLGVLAQRLVRINCRHCAVDVPPGESLRLPAAIGRQLEGRTLVRGQGCADCRHSGYQGRALVAELMRVGPAMAGLIAEASDRARLLGQAEAEGWRPLADHAVTMLLSGHTSLDEVRPLLLDAT